MVNIKHWQLILAFVLSVVAVGAKAAQYIDSRVDERVQAVAVPRTDFDRLEGKVDRITDILLSGSPKRR